MHTGCMLHVHTMEAHTFGQRTMVFLTNLLSAQSWMHIGCMFRHFIVLVEFSFLPLSITIFYLGFYKSLGTYIERCLLRFVLITWCVSFNLLLLFIIILFTYFCNKPFWLAHHKKMKLWEHKKKIYHEARMIMSTNIISKMMTTMTREITIGRKRTPTHWPTYEIQNLLYGCDGGGGGCV